MGGSSYDRDVYSSNSSFGFSNFGASSYSRRVFSNSNLDSSMLPNGKIIESKTKYPIIIVLDVTGSNIDFARVVYDKLPMFYGQIEQQGYLDDFDIAFCAVGDAYTDSYPIQICDFSKGIAIDSEIKKIVLESGGGGQKRESYELMAYYLYNNTKFDKKSNPIIFFIGDEMPYPTVNKDQANMIGIKCNENNIDSFSLLREKVNDNVFMLLNKYSGDRFYPEITESWQKLLAAEHLIKIKEEKSIVDLMLGIIAMISDTRTLDDYKEDMQKRGQTSERISNVSNSLEDLSSIKNPIKITGNITDTSNKESIEKGKRL